MEESTKLTLAS